jgi:hypothetical protein
MDGFLMSLGFKKSLADSNLYYYSVGDESLILMTYSESLVGYKLSLTSDFEIKDMSMMHYFLDKKYDKGPMRFS